MESLIFLILTIVFLIAFLNSADEEDFKFSGFILLISTLVSSIFLINSFFIKDIKSYKVDLPEEIVLAKQGDTLIINKIIKDSIYLGYNKFKK